MFGRHFLFNVNMIFDENRLENIIYTVSDDCYTYIYIYYYSKLSRRVVSIHKTNINARRFRPIIIISRCCHDESKRTHDDATQNSNRFRNGIINTKMIETSERAIKTFDSIALVHVGRNRLNIWSDEKGESTFSAGFPRRRR